MEFRDYQRMRVVLKNEIRSYHKAISDLNTTFKNGIARIKTLDDADPSKETMMKIVSYIRNTESKYKQRIKKLAVLQYEVKRNLR